MTENKDSKTTNGQFSVSKKCSYSDQMREYRDTSPQIVMSTRKKVTFHDARQVADMCMIVISHAHIVQDKI